MLSKTHPIITSKLRGDEITGHRNHTPVGDNQKMYSEKLVMKEVILLQVPIIQVPSASIGKKWQT